MRKIKDNRSSRAAFTLIEVLTAMLLVIVLMLALFPGMRAASTNAKRHTATSEALEIAGAALAYRQVYGMWPCENDRDVKGTASNIVIAGATKLTSPGLTEGYHRDIGKIIEVLQCGDVDDMDKYNPRRIVFLELPDSCFHKKDGTGAAYPYDPWGRPYVMIMSRMMDDKVNRLEGGIRMAIPDNDYDVKKIITATDDVVVFSWGDLEFSPRGSSQTNGISGIIGSWSTR